MSGKMLVSTLCFALVLGACLCSPMPLGASSDVVAQRLQQEIDNFKAIMSTGDAKIGLPVTDPLVEDTIPLESNTDIFQASGFLNDMRVVGLSSFSQSVVQSSGGAKNGRVTLTVEIAEASASTEYDLQGNIKLGFLTVPISGKSLVSAKINGIKASADLDITINDDNSLTIDQISNVDYSFSKLQAIVGAFNAVVNKLLNKLLPKIIKGDRSKIIDAIETLGKVNINKYFDLIAGKTPKTTVSTTLAHLVEGVTVSAAVEMMILQILHQVHAVAA